MTGATVLHVSNSNLLHMALPVNTDYVFICDEVLTGLMRVQGGRNISMIGFEWNIPLLPGPDTTSALYMQDQAADAVIHIEGVRARGAGMSDWLNIQQTERNITQVQNVYVDELHAIDEVNFTDIHPDLIQSWRGPDILRVDRMSGNTPVQGIFLEPFDQPGGYAPTLADIRNSDFRCVRSVGSSYRPVLVWCEGGAAVSAHNVWLDTIEPWPFAAPGTTNRACMVPGPDQWGADSFWPGIPPGGRFVDPDAVGLGYVSPGYA